MQCPSCKSELVVTGQEKLETLNEHVSCVAVTPKDKYECLNKDCKLHGLDVCWNEDGEYYRGYRHKVDNSFFINGNTAPFGSMFRSINVETKRDTFLLFTWPLWPWVGWKCFLEVTYKSDYDGNILRRYRKLCWVTNEGIYHIGTFRMLRFCIGKLISSRGKERKKLCDQHINDNRKILWVVIMRFICRGCLIFMKD